MTTLDEHFSPHSKEKWKISQSIFFSWISILFLLNLFSVNNPALQGIWANAIVNLCIFIVVIIFNSSFFYTKWLSWTNIFLSLLFVFHLGYYIPAKLNLAERISYLPSVNDPYLPLGMTIFWLAFFSFEISAILTQLVASPKKDNSKKLFDSVNSYPVLHLGVLVSLVSFVLFVVYIYQLGGVIHLLNSNYKDYVSFLSSSDPRFAAISITYLPTGLLLLISGLHLKSSNRGILCVIKLFLFLFIFWLLWIGNRGMALLVGLSYLYIHNLIIKKIPFRTFLVLALILLFMIPLVKNIRSIEVKNRFEAITLTNINVLDAFTEMGGTIRPYLGFVRLTALGLMEDFTFQPYYLATLRLVPNMGANLRSSETYNNFYRSNIFITRVLDPISASLGYGIGSSGIAEPYYCFGASGVVVFFCFLGFITTKIEINILKNKSIYSLVLFIFFFVPINWYIRDDIYGTLRPLVWGWLLTLLAHLYKTITEKRLVRR